MFLSPLITSELLSLATEMLPWRLNGIHGVPHWEAVERLGLSLAESQGADREVVSLFALFHDCRRFNEDYDPDHGKRGAMFARDLFVAGYLPINETQLELLLTACEGHTDILYSDNPTVACCWDADRLDLGRVGISPEPEMLNTETAKRIAEGLAPQLSENSLDDVR